MDFSKEIFENQLDQARYRFYKKFRSILKKTPQFTSATKVLVGLSAGLDSSVLLHMLTLYHRLDKGPVVLVGHIHHGVRGEFAHRDQRAAQEMARVHQAPFFMVKLAPLVGASEDHLRALRMEALSRIAFEQGAQLIVLGHHQDDQAETLLMKMLRGTDIRGLCGVRQVRDHQWFRPLLTFTRQQLAVVAEAGNLFFVNDETNDQTHFGRNFVRHQLLPLVKSQINPNISKQLAGMTESFLELDIWIESETQKLQQKAYVKDNCYDRIQLQQSAVVLRKRLYQNIFQNIQDKDAMLSRQQLRLLDKVVMANSHKTIDLNGSVGVECLNNVIIFKQVEKK